MPADMTPPVLTSLSLPSHVDVSAGDVAVTAMVGASDVGIGVLQVYVEFERGFQTEHGLEYGFYLYDSEDSFADGTSSTSQIFTSLTASGTYGIRQVTVYDKAGNYTLYDTDDLASLGFQTAITVTGGAAPDTAPPVLTSLSLPSHVDVSAGDVAVTAMVGASDVGIGVLQVYVEFERGFQTEHGLEYGFYLYDSEDSFADGTSSTSQIFTSLTASGSYGIRQVTVYDKAGNYTLYNTEDLASLGFQTAITVQNRRINGSGSNDTLTGTPRADIIDGRAGADRMSGLSGDDLYFADNLGDRVFESANGGNDRVEASVSYLLAGGQSIETLALANAAGTAALKLTGNEIGQRLVGNAGTNFLDGGKGADSLYGLAGNDTYLVDNSGDRVFEIANAGSDRVNASLSYVLGAGQSIETLALADASATSSLTLTGNEIGQRLVGNAGANTLDGKGGADSLYGLAGDDIYLVDNAGDLVFESTNAGTDRVNASLSYALGAGQSVETLALANAAGTSALNLTGNDLGQRVLGNAGANLIDGGGGADNLYGLGGADTFRFSTALGSGNVDRIADFSVADDTIQLDRTIFSALNLGTLTAGAYKDIGDPGAVVDGNDRILYNDDTGQLFYDADGSGAIARIHFATLDTKPATLTTADFFVVD